MRTVLAIATFLTAISISSIASAEETKPPHKWVGLGLDLGAPEGGAVGLAVSPYYYWLKVTGSYTNNYFASGGRLGVTLDPIKFGVAPTFTTEYGFTGRFNPSDTVGEKLPDASYQYVNFQPGIEFGNPNGFRFFIRAGLTHLWASTHNFNDVVKTENIVVGDPRANLWIFPTFKLGATILVF